MAKSTQTFRQASREEFPEQQRLAMRKAMKWQIFTICYTGGTLVVVAFVLGGSQAMTTAWIEDMLSLLPQLSFLTALFFMRRKPDREHPYGWHRSMSIGHLLAGAALLAVGGKLAFDSIETLVKQEKVQIDDVQLFGYSIWLGWIMIGVMVVIVIGPLFLYGPAKAKLAPVLHSKLLYADADMAKADWHTNAASIVGVLGIGAGLWWLDGVAALFISIGIVRDGWKNSSAAVRDLMDRRARIYDGERPHPLGIEIVKRASAAEWVRDAGVRLRDQGQVFHAEVFVVPDATGPSLERLAALAEAIAALDWKLQDVVVVPTDPLPPYADRDDTSSHTTVVNGVVADDDTA